MECAFRTSNVLIRVIASAQLDRMLSAPNLKLLKQDIQTVLDRYPTN